MKRVVLLLALVVGMATFAKSQDYSGLIKTVTLTNAQTDSTVVTIPGSRSAVTFKYDITKTSGTIAGTIVLQYKVTALGSEKWYTYNTYTLTDASVNTAISLPNNPALIWKVLAVTSGTSVSTHRYYLLYRK